MTKVHRDRMTVEMDGDFVVFLIGMRINKPWKVHKWLPVFLAMPRMLRELRAHPDSGFLGAMSAGMTIVQYWRSFDDLERYARSRDHEHWPAWVAFNKRMAASRSPALAPGWAGTDYSTCSSSIAMKGPCQEWYQTSPE